jgi:chemosensory pili system protein ChpA (sensor histidine kinase/response regulator)
MLTTSPPTQTHAGANPSSDDLSTLAWVSGELQRSLDAAHKSLRRYLKEAQAIGDSDVDSADVAILRAARVQLHQGVGALELVGLSIPARVLRASETAVQRLSGKPELVDGAAVDTIEAASFAVLDFLHRTLARRPISSVALFPQYRAVQQLAGGDRIHPADLWGQNWRWQELPGEAGLTARVADDHARDGMEALVLALMRRPDAAAMVRMSDYCAELGAGARSTLASTVWRLAAAFFDAQSCGLLDSDVYAKRMASRLLAQLKANVRSDGEVSERLASDLLFFCARAKVPGEHQAPRLRAVRAAWQLGDSATGTDYDTPRLGRFDPAVIAQARKRIAGAKDVWSAVAGGDLRRLSNLGEAFALLGDSISRLLPAGELLTHSLQTASVQTAASGEAPSTGLAMEMATAVLWLDAVIEEAEFDSPGLAERTQQVARRVDLARAGGAVQPLEPWIEELYRRVSDHQTMGSVVQELRASLTEIEKQIDQYFRNPALREVLVPVPAQLSAMRGVLSVLDLEQGSAAVVHMRNAVDALAATEVDPAQATQAGTFDHLADNLGALGFLIDMLSVQPQLAKQLFHFDPASGRLLAATGPTTLGVHPQAEGSVESLGTAEAAAPSLAQEAQSLAEAAALPHLSDEDLSRQLEQLSQRAVVDDESELARVAANAQQALSVAGDDEAKAAVRADLAQAVSDLVVTVPIPELPVSAPVAMPRADAKPVAPGDTGLEDDAEMRGIFLEEAQEVIVAAQQSLVNLAANAESLSDITVVRRSFHTLKGSARMVGLRDFGEAAWACEQVYNARLADDPRVDPTLHAFTRDALDELGHWVGAIEAGDASAHSSGSLVQRALVLRGGVPEAAAVAVSAPLASAAPVAAETPMLLDFAEPAPAAPAEVALTPDADIEAEAEVEPEALSLPEPQPLSRWVPDVPSASDLDLPPLSLPSLPTNEEPAPAAPALAEAMPEFSLDLGDFDLEPAPLPVPEIVLPKVSEMLPLEAVSLDLSALDEPGFDETDAAGHETTVILPAPLPAAAQDEQADEVMSLDVDFELDLGPDGVASEMPADEAVLEIAALAGADVDPADDEAVEEPIEELAELGDGGDMQALLASEAALEEEEPVKLIGPLRIAIPLFNIFLNEADEQSRRLVTELAEWALEYRSCAVPEAAVSLAHSLAGNSATVGYAELSGLARSLEHALMRSAASGLGREAEPELFNDAADEIRRLLHQFAAGFLKPVPEPLLLRLADHEHWPRPVEPAPAEAPVAPTPEAAQAPVVPVAPVLAAAALAAAVPNVRSEDDEIVGIGEEGDEGDQVDAQDAIDDELLPIFEEEAEELLPQLQSQLRDWVANPTGRSAPDACMRTLHTFKGGARLAGAMRVGELAHRLETGIEELLARENVGQSDIEPLQGRLDRIISAFDATRHAARVVPAEAVVAAPPAPAPVLVVPEPQPEPEPPPPAMPAFVATLAPSAAPAAPFELAPIALAAGLATAALAAQSSEPAAAAAQPQAPAPANETTAESVAEPVTAPTPEPVSESAPEPTPALVAPVAPAAPVVEPRRIDWARFANVSAGPVQPAATLASTAGSGIVRVRTSLLDRLVNGAGEVSIARARIESDVRSLQSSLDELTGSLERMRRELRDIEVQAETQISSRIEAAKASAQSFDPLEMDRFTRLQELTRMMAESVNDVATVQRGLTRTLQSTEDQLAAQSRLTRELQDDLLRTRMVEFESLAERLYRVVRQAARDTGKQVRLDIVGGSIEVDRGVLERMVGPFEHLLRNSVVHGIESPEARLAVGKDASGAMVVKVTQSGNEVGVEFDDDGAGLDLKRIRERALERGLLAADAQPSDAELAQLIFVPGFTTASAVTELAGRGIGMDVVRAEVFAMGGRIETVNRPNKGASFKLVLPLTTAVTQVVMLRCGSSTIAVPSTLVEVVRRVPNAEVMASHSSGEMAFGGESVGFYWLTDLLEGDYHEEGDVVLQGRSQAVAIIRSAAQRVALHIDEVVGNQEVVVKNLGPQLSRMPGLAGVTLLPSGAVALIYNPVALAALYGDDVRQRRLAQLARQAQRAQQAQDALTLPLADRVPSADVVVAEALAPLVMVVDDSLTVRRVTQRLLEREGYRVALAKDGVDALEKLAHEIPAVMLCDIEMPRMDGFELVRTLRADAQRAGIPVVMITSRIAQKHRDHAAQLGVEHYLGKPYPEEKLLSLVAQYARAAAVL